MQQPWANAPRADDIRGRPLVPQLLLLISGAWTKARGDPGSSGRRTVSQAGIIRVEPLNSPPGQRELAGLDRLLRGRLLHLTPIVPLSPPLVVPVASSAISPRPLLNFPSALLALTGKCGPLCHLLPPLPHVNCVTVPRTYIPS